MATRILTQQRLQELLKYDPETGVFTNRVTRNGRAKVDDNAGYVNALGYVVIQIDGKKLHAHRLAWLYMHGHWPINQIDHINRNPTDNRICNLRDVTASENAHNISFSKRNTSGVRNVVWSKKNKKWQAQIMVNNKYKYLGLFDELTQAAMVAEDAIKKYQPARVW
jgi:hypothetical protein